MHSSRTLTNSPPRRHFRITNACPSRNLVLHCYAEWAGSLANLQAGTKIVESSNLGCLPQDLHYLASAQKNAKSLTMEVGESVHLPAQNANTSHSCAKNRTGHPRLVRNPRHAVILGGRRRRRREPNEEIAMRVMETDPGIGIGIRSGMVMETVSESEIGTELGMGEEGEEVVIIRHIPVAQVVTAAITDELIVLWTITAYLFIKGGLLAMVSLYFYPHLDEVYSLSWGTASLNHEYAQ